MRQCVTSTPVSHPVRHSSVWRAGFLFLLISLIFFSHSIHVAAEEPTTDNAQTMTWPMLPGENLKQLAALFYPDNQAMQQIFIKQTLLLSRDIHPDLSADTRVDQLTSVIIPDIKALSRKAAPPAKVSTLKMAHQMGERSIAIVTEAMWREYEALKQSNLLLSQELEKLHARLDNLQATFLKVKQAALNFLSKQAAFADKAAANAKAAPQVIATRQDRAPAQEKAPAQDKVTAQEKPAVKAVAAQETQAPTQKAPIQVAQLDTSAKESRAFSWPFSILHSLIVAGLLALTIAVVYGLNLRRQRSIDTALENQNIVPIDWPITEINSSDGGEEVETMPYVALIHPDSLASSSESLEQARILSGSGRPKAAIALLESVIENQPDASVEGWLYLLDLYREAGMKTKFIEYAQRLHTSFNVMTPQWEIKEVALVLANSLEEFPHIVEQLVEHWQDGSAQDYLNSLLKDNREGERAGFSIPVLQEIMLLKSIIRAKEAGDSIAGNPMAA